MGLDVDPGGKRRVLRELAATPAALIRASPAISVMRTKRQIQDVTRPPACQPSSGYELGAFYRHGDHGHRRPRKQYDHAADRKPHRGAGQRDRRPIRPRSA